MEEKPFEKLKKHGTLLWILLFFVIAVLVFTFDMAGYILLGFLIVELFGIAGTLRNTKLKNKPIERDDIWGLILFIIGAGIWYIGVIAPAAASGGMYPSPSAAVKGIFMVIGYVLIGAGLQQALGATFERKGKDNETSIVEKA